MGRVQTFLLADLVGYTALTEAMGDDSAADVAVDFSLTVRGLLPQYDGEEIKTIGDALLVRVPDAGRAVQLGARIASEFGRRHGSLHVSVGLHTGSAVERGGDWFGSAVNLAARVAEQARPGEVLMTSATVEAAGKALVPAQVRSRGERALKNLLDPVELYALVVVEPDTEPGLPLDPVCRMVVDPARSRHAFQYRGLQYHFCSETCREAFMAEPGRYAI
jgi:class 3 adenylate cyclase